MFSLIIAIVSIALVVALVVVGGYYGGSAILDANARAEASRLKNEEQQILAGVDMFRSDRGTWPMDVEQLVSHGYLRSVPKGLKTAAQAPGFELLSSAHAAEAALGWTTVVPGQPIFLSQTGVPMRVCREYNMASRGDDGILKQAYSVLPAQCYGTEGNYRIVFYKPAAGVIFLGDALGGGVLDGGLPAPNGGDDWWAELPRGDILAPTDPSKVPTPLLTLSMNSINFGQVGVGLTSPTTTVTLTNSGNRELTGLAQSTLPDGFVLEHSTCAATLPVSGSCALGLSFAPTSDISYTGKLDFTSSARAVSLSLSGSGMLPSLDSDIALTQDIGAGPALAKHVARYTFSNNGTLPVTLGRLSRTSSTGYANAGSCAEGAEVEPGESCYVEVGFGPEQDEAASLTAAAILPTSGGEKSMSVTGSSLQPQWNLVSTNPAAAAAGKPYTAVVRLTNPAPTPFTFGGGTTPDGKFILALEGAAKWTYASSTCGTALQPNETCDVSLSTTPESANVPEAARLYPSGSLGDFVNRQVVASSFTPKQFKEQAVSVTPGPADFSSLLATYVNNSYMVTPFSAWVQSMGNWAAVHPGGAVRTDTAETQVGKLVTIAGNVAVKAKLRFAADDGIRNLMVNGVAVATETGSWSTVTESSMFTLLPGVNAVTFVSMNTPGGPGGWAAEVWNQAGTTRLSDTTGWRYAGPEQLVPLSGANPNRHVFDYYPVGCKALRTPPQGFQPATVSGFYMVSIGRGPETVYCDMTTDGGGWTLIARSVPGAATNNNFGWFGTRSTPTDLSNAYSMGVLNVALPFNEVLLGNSVAYTHSWGSYVYKKPLTRESLGGSGYSGILGSSASPVSGAASSNFSMTVCAGYASSTPNNFFFRDSCGDPNAYGNFGLFASGWATYYGTGPADVGGQPVGASYGGYINGSQGMMMVR